MVRLDIVYFVENWKLKIIKNNFPATVHKWKYCSFALMHRSKKKKLKLKLTRGRVDAQSKWYLSIYLTKIIFINLFYYLVYFCYYLWVSLHFLVLFIGHTILFQLTFTFIYNIFSKKFSILAKQVDSKQILNIFIILIKWKYNMKNVIFKTFS